MYSASAHFINMNLVRYINMVYNNNNINNNNNNVRQDVYKKPDCLFFHKYRYKMCFMTL